VLTTRYPIGPLKELAELVRRVIVPLFAETPVWELLVISAAAGWGEELLFRGLLQTLVSDWTGHAWLGLLVASLLFGLVHPMSVTYFVVATLIGFYLGWLLLATDNLLVPMIAHGAYDFVALVYLLHGTDSAAEGDL
jgi:membrane protease YdiL (CAAX protease family)